MADETTLTTGTELVPADQINTYVDAYPRPNRVGRKMAWVEMGKPGVAFRFPRWEQESIPAGTVTEAADATRVAFDTAENSATPARVAMEVSITDHLKMSAVVQIEAAVIDEAIRAFLDRMDSDILAVAASATSTDGAFTDVLDQDKWMDGLNTHIALDTAQDGMLVCVLGHSSAASLRKAIGLTSASKQVGSTLFDGAAGSEFLGSYLGCELFESGNVATESGGNNNFFSLAGDRLSGLGLVLGWDLRVQADRGAEGNRAAKDFIVFDACYGTGVTHASRITELRAA